MDTFAISFPLAVLCPTEAFFPSVDRVTDALADLEDCSPELLDSAVSADLGTRMAQFEVTISASTAGEALDQAVTLVRTAIHAAGDGTPGWEAYWPKIKDDLVTRQVAPCP